MMRLEFNGKLDGVEEEKKVKIDFKLKTRDEHLQ